MTTEPVSIPQPDPRKGQSWYQIGFELAMRRQSEGKHRPTEAELRRATKMDDADLVEFGEGWNDGAIHQAFLYIERLVKRVTDTIERFALTQLLVKVTEDLLESDSPSAADSAPDATPDSASDSAFDADFDLDDPPPAIPA